MFCLTLVALFVKMNDDNSRLAENCLCGEKRTAGTDLVNGVIKTLVKTDYIITLPFTNRGLTGCLLIMKKNFQAGLNAMIKRIRIAYLLMIFGKFMLVRNAARFVIPSYSIHLSVYKAANQKQIKEVDSEEEEKKKHGRTQNQKDPNQRSAK